MILNNPARLSQTHTRPIRSSLSSTYTSSLFNGLFTLSTSFRIQVGIAGLVIFSLFSDFLSSPLALLLVSLGSIACLSLLARRSVALPVLAPPRPAAGRSSLPVSVETDELEAEKEERNPVPLSHLRPLSRYSLVSSETAVKPSGDRKLLSTVYPRVHEWARDLGRFVVDRVLTGIVNEAKSIDQLLHSTAAMNGIVYVSPDNVASQRNCRLFSIGDLQIPKELSRLTDKIQRRKEIDNYFQVSGIARAAVNAVFAKWVSEGRIDPDYMEEDSSLFNDGERRRDERILFHLLLTIANVVSADSLGIYRSMHHYEFESMTGSILEVFAAALHNSKTQSLLLLPQTQLRRLVQSWGV